MENENLKQLLKSGQEKLKESAMQLQSKQTIICSLSKQLSMNTSHLQPLQSLQSITSSSMQSSMQQQLKSINKINRINNNNNNNNVNNVNTMNHLNSCRDKPGTIN